MRLAVFSLFIAAAAPALAQPAPEGCYITRDGPMIAGNTAAYFDQNLTANWLATQRAANPQLMASIAGTYYIEIVSPNNDAVSRSYRTIDANGLFSYQDQTCGGFTCSNNGGHGQWVAHATQRNTIYLMINWSDLSRTSACISAELYMDGSDLVGAGDQIRWRRVQ